VADKFTPLILDAITLAASAPAGTPLYATKTGQGLFANSTAGKAAARKALDEGLLQVSRSEMVGKILTELVTATDRGLSWLVQAQSPKKVLEDFVRVLEARETQVNELLTQTQALRATLDGVKATVSQLLPQITSERLPAPDTRPPEHASRNGLAMKTQARNGTTTLLLDPATEIEELTGAILARLSDWASSAAAGQDCPLPELYRALGVRPNPPSLGMFHDCIRKLHEEHRIYLHPWTGPLYALPEPSAALLVGHNIAYYASLRN
jgi:hypothetical protein